MQEQGTVQKSSQNLLDIATISGKGKMGHVIRFSFLDSHKERKERLSLVQIGMKDLSFSLVADIQVEKSNM